MGAVLIALLFSTRMYANLLDAVDITVLFSDQIQPGGGGGVEWERHRIYRPRMKLRPTGCRRVAASLTIPLPPELNCLLM